MSQSPNFECPGQRASKDENPSILRAQSVLFNNVDLVLVDVDNTLVFPKDKNFYRQYSGLLENLVARTLELSPEEAALVINYYRRQTFTGQRAVEDLRLNIVAEEILGRELKPTTVLPIGYDHLYREFDQIDPAENFSFDPGLRPIIQTWQAGRKVAAVTDCSEGLSRRILNLVGIDPDADFHAYYPWRLGSLGPPKHVTDGQILSEVARGFGVPPERTLVIGDSLNGDILPALRQGMQACLVGHRGDYDGIMVKTVAEIRFY